MSGAETRVRFDRDTRIRSLAADSFILRFVDWANASWLVNAHPKLKIAPRTLALYVSDSPHSNVDKGLNRRTIPEINESQFPESICQCAFRTD